MGLLFIFLTLKTLAQTPLFAQNTYKIGITKTNVYKIDATFLKKMGVNVAEINPKNLRLFGNGGAMLPQSNATQRPADLTENAVFVKGEDDGRFDDGDALWFFGQGPHVISYDSLNQQLTHQINHYSDTTFYFLQISNQAGLRLKNQPSGSSGELQTSFDDYVFEELESYNPIQSGREWWGQYFSIQTQQDFSFDAKGLVANAPLRLTAQTFAAAQVPTKFSFSVNGQSLGSQNHETVTTYRYDYKGLKNKKLYTGILADASALKVTVNFDRNGQLSAAGYLDFLGIQCKRSLRMYDQATVFQTLTTNKDSIRYAVVQATDATQIWDISDVLRPQNQRFTLRNGEVTFGTSAKTLRRFVVFSEIMLQTPVSFQKIQNQNIHNLQTPQLLIVTAKNWRKQAQKLAAFRQQNDGLETLVVTTDEVFNEFSSGQPDPTAIRDYVRYLYNRQPNKLKYLLLFGDATFDYKNNSKTQSATQRANFVPTYESRESAHPVFSFSSDDYFGLLKNNDGNWEENFGDKSTLDIGIGRLPVKNIEEAEIVVNKLERYASKRSKGKWRQAITFVADDGDGNLHQDDANTLANMIGQNSPTFGTKKIFLDAYNQIVSPEKQRSPEASQAIDNAINSGTLILNYTGHGGENIWAEEQLVTLQNILSWHGLDNMPLIITATCEFGRYDNSASVSGAELAVLNPRGGAVAMLSTARPVYANTNFLLNDAFYKTIFTPINGQMPRLGDAMRITKNNSISGVLNRNFTLLGDPSLRLNYPENQIVISTTDTLKAGKLVKLTGEVQQNQKRKTDFDGTAFVSVFDKENQVLTKGTESSPMSFGQFQNKIFEGQVSVRQGQFTAQFIVPKNIDPKLGTGRVQVYAISNDSLTDAAGANNKILVGGSALQSDSRPPVLQLFMNDPSFVDGSDVPQNSTFFAKISDENGFSLSKNDMVLTINDTTTMVMNDYFSANKDDYRNGLIRYDFEQLPEGVYKLHLKVWDTYNNSAEATLNFRLVSQPQVVKGLKVYPNPLVESTNFWIEPLDNEQDIETELQIFDVSGRKLFTKKNAHYGVFAPLNIFMWNGINDQNQPLPKGTYLYKLNVGSLSKNQSQFLSGKILIVR